MTKVNKHEIALAEAIAARDKFLEAYPHLKEYQNKITETLDKIPEQQDKVTALTIMIASNFVNMQEKFVEIRKILGKTEAILLDGEQ